MSSGEEEDEENTSAVAGLSDLSRATSRQILTRANESARTISWVVEGPTSKLNKADLAAINTQLSVLMEAEVASKAWQRERSRVQKAEAEAKEVKKSAMAAAMRASEAAA
ncbi:unnamed protein product [Diatraea saccharalis]|uniref:Uncharacterized protein n=1 Tax=Diatraea saccharalis TaxID=40085 RepID=A0A9N9WGZ4_9NEOP|nr:unnamed protein product [Diatraea saccharalis]